MRSLGLFIAVNTILVLVPDKINTSFEVIILLKKHSSVTSYVIADINRNGLMPTPAGNSCSIVNG